ncbi:SRPBCC domain-containing protein [Nocardia sp. CDC159]|uniref:SRPBCC domain-containing protein n=1 Tax=Nocardia pulmonis TaxID=2951408 RepID=A0A9X2E9I0_9NOCA|nr:MULTISPECIES: SRPBCC domain-containing protein [Nocardia]MCM6774286.1 SRPBCC domain-containing protein [Nocardia pulmonis]MCM6787173.1 SRPBCC domain-containing protein [Nocardia sp. CDC159]
MTDDLTTIELDHFYPHAPEKVWRALTTPDLMAQWMMRPTGFEPVVGNVFHMRGRAVPQTGFSGEIRCEVLELTAPKRLSLGWCDAQAAADPGWVVTWELHPEGTGTRLLFTHTGFDPDDPKSQLSRQIMRGGWPGMLARLEQSLPTA